MSILAIVTIHNRDTLKFSKQNIYSNRIILDVTYEGVLQKSGKNMWYTNNMLGSNLITHISIIVYYVYYYMTNNNIPR